MVYYLILPNPRRFFSSRFTNLWCRCRRLVSFHIVIHNLPSFLLCLFYHSSMMRTIFPHMSLVVLVIITCPHFLDMSLPNLQTEPLRSSCSQRCSVEASGRVPNCQVWSQIFYHLLGEYLVKKNRLEFKVKDVMGCFNHLYDDKLRETSSIKIVRI